MIYRRNRQEDMVGRNKLTRQPLEISTDDPFVTNPWNKNNYSKLRSSVLPKSCFLVVVIVLIWIFSEPENSRVNKDVLSEQLQEVGHTSLEYCIDPDDPIEERQQLILDRKCYCLDPKIPARRPISDKSWDDFHKIMMQDVQAAVVGNHKLDFIMVGDSITERWNGTKGIGRVKAPEFREVFEEFFDQTKNDNAPLNGLALGASGDISVELLWHLQNGIVESAQSTTSDMDRNIDDGEQEQINSKYLNPDVWVILIGTNDIGRSGCSKRTVLAGILQVANYLHMKRPGIPIIVHGLLPRSDNFGSPTNYTLGYMWNMIVWINIQLKKFCEVHENWHFLDVNEIFLQSVKQDNGADVIEINSELMNDALHPSVKGCKLWGPLLVDKIQKLIKR